MQQLELTVYQLREKIIELEEKLEKAEAERDSLLLSSDGATVPGPDGIPIHPVILKHINTIAFLKTKLQEAEERALVAMNNTRPSTAMNNTLTRQSLVSAAMRASVSRLNVVDYNPRVSETIEKAKDDIRKELKNLQNRVRRSPLPKKPMASTGTTSRRPSHSGKTDRRNNEAFEDMDDDQDEDDNRDDLDADASDSEAKSTGPHASNELGPTTAGTEEQMMNFLDQIQSDIAIKEELVLQLEKTQSGFHAMKEKYEDKLKQLQDNLLALQQERDVALKKMDGGGDGSEKVVRRWIILSQAYHLICKLHATDCHAQDAIRGKSTKAYARDCRVPTQVPGTTARSGR